MSGGRRDGRARGPGSPPRESSTRGVRRTRTSTSTRPHRRARSALLDSAGGGGGQGGQGGGGRHAGRARLPPALRGAQPGDTAQQRSASRRGTREGTHTTLVLCTEHRAQGTQEAALQPADRAVQGRRVKQRRWSGRSSGRATFLGPALRADFVTVVGPPTHTHPGRKSSPRPTRSPGPPENTRISREIEPGNGDTSFRA